MRIINFGSTIAAMDMKEIRVKNLGHLIKLHGRKVVEEKAGYVGSTAFGQLVTGAGSFGNKVAKRFEDAFKLAPNWMSERHPELWDDRTPLSSEDFKGMLAQLETVLSRLPEEERKQAVIDVVKSLSQF